MSAWIEIRDLDVTRGNRPVLKGITASLAGKAVGLVGANGAGKSTLIGALLGVLRPRSGSVRVLDLPVPERALDVRARSGVMAEQAGIYPGGSGVDAVSYAGMLSGLPRRESLRRAHRALDALDVGEERYRPTSGYSTGMRQRCKLAMSLVHDPEVLILDEPTVGLDPPGRLQLLSLIRDLRDDGRRILLSTHILPDAEFLCDELLLLEQGTVGYCGPVQSLVTEGAGDMLAEITGVSDDVLARFSAAGLEATRNETHMRFLTRNDDDLRTFWRIAAEADLEVRSLRHTSVSLEDAVIDAMHEASARLKAGGGETLESASRAQDREPAERPDQGDAP